MPETELPLPNFLIIGAQKSATRWLRHNLGLHPDIFTADYELAFFNRRRYQTLGTDWYRAQFDGWSGEQFVGEATPGYMIWHHAPAGVARRIKDTVPDVKLIAILRNPVDRANSAMVHHKRRERIRPNAKLMDLVRAQPPEEERYGLIAGGWYAATLRPYKRLFGDQLLVLLQDDVRDDPLPVYERALQHIGAPSSFVPSELDEVVFSNQQGSGRWRSELSPEDRAELYEYFREDIRKLERMFDLDLSMWHPDPSFTAPGSGPGGAAARMLATYDAATAWLEVVVGNVAPIQYDTPTREPGQTVKMLLDRLTGSALYFSAILRRTQMGDPRTPAERAGFADDPAAEYRHAAALLRGAMAAKANLRGTVVTPTGPRRAATVARTAMANQLATGWELAVSTGQEAALPPGLVEPVAGIAREIVAWLPAGPASSNGATAAGSSTLMERFLTTLDAAAGRSRT